MSTNKYETIIIGLGAAGATAAATLARAGRRILALEADSRIGGRVQTVPFGDGVVELGAEWIHGSESSRVFDAATQNNIVLIPQDLDLIVYKSNGELPGPDYQELFNELVEYIFVATMIPSDKPEPLGEYCTRKLMEFIKQEKPELLNEKELIDHVLSYSNMLMNNYNASNDWNDIDSHGKYEHLDGHQHLSWHKYGYKTFFDVLLNKDIGFPTLDIKLGTEVTEIQWPRDRQDVVTISCKNNSVYTADNVVVTISLGVLKERHTHLFKPELPVEKVEAIKNIQMGVMDKIELSFDTIWWPLDAVFFGFLWNEEDRKKVAKEDYWMTKVFAASRPMGSKNVLTLWTSGEVAKLVETLAIDEVKRKCREILQRFMGGKLVVPEPSGIERSTWFTNPFTKGSYTFDHIKSSKYVTARADLASPLVDSAGHPRVLFAGEATHETRYSTVHGAADTGYREAERLLPKVSKL